MLDLIKFAPLSMAFVLLAAIALCVVAVGPLLRAWMFRRASHSRSQQPEAYSQVQSKKATEAEYANIFPPSQRALLREVDAAAFASPAEVSLNYKSILALTADYRLANPASYIFSGFSVAEVLKLGDFPDYAKLSGVPLPSPLKNFNIEKAVARPYRPFRWAYHQTMSYKKLEPDYWLELETNYRARILQRQNLYAQHGKDVLQALPGSELACKELMEMALQFLCARYPEHFEISGNTFMNRILNTTENLKETQPLMVLLNNVPEDFAITLRDPETGRYCFRAGVVCSSVGWKLSEKIGLGLPAIHRTVPDYKEKMEFSMDRFFTKMPTYHPIQRGSWGLEIGQPLFLPSSHPDFSHRETQNQKLTPDEIFLRVDWQTLRRLPLSGGIVFNFKALFTPISEFRDEPYIPTLVLKVLNEGKESLMKYKGTWHVEHVVKPKLREWEREQIDQGMMEADWAPRTLDESPFFRGWEKKWTSN